MGMGVREYARHRGVAHSAVAKALTTGRIKKGADGLIDPVLADAAWDRNTNQAQQRVPPPQPAPVRQPAPRHEPELEPGPGGSQVPSYQFSRAIKEAFSAKIARITYEDLARKRVKAEDVARDWFEAGRRVRDRMLGLPSRLAAILASETEAKTIEQLLDDEIRNALEDLAQ